MRIYIVCLSVLSVMGVFSMDSDERFEQIVKDNLNNPQAIVDQLRSWQEAEKRFSRNSKRIFGNFWWTKLQLSG